MNKTNKKFITIKGEYVGMKHNIEIIKHYNSPDSYFRDLAKHQNNQFSSFEMIDITSQYSFKNDSVMLENENKNQNYKNNKTNDTSSSGDD